jgi:hypothetical protein
MTEPIANETAGDETAGGEEPLPIGPPAPRKKNGRCVAIFLLLAPLVVGAAVFTWAMLIGGTVAFEVPVGDDPTTTPVEVPREGVMRFYAVVDVENESHAEANTAELPHLLDYEIELRDGDRVVGHAVCNPFAAHRFARTSDRGSTTRSYEGRLDGCGFRVPEGHFEVSVVRRWREQDPRFAFRRTALVGKVL